MTFWRRSKRGEKVARPWPVGTAGKRAYAIGDVHGCADLLERLLERIAEDEQRSPARIETYIIFLGDLIDRGADSAGVIDRLMSTDWGHVKPVFLTGNHEEMLLRIMGEEPELVLDWLTYGGYEFAQSYGVDVGALLTMKAVDIVQLLREKVPRAHLDFLASFADSFRFGDYLFVHAGIRPGVPIDHQVKHDLRWIREGFIDVVRNDGLMVVHGHTILGPQDTAPDRIGIDTGAYRDGHLTAICVDGEERRFIRVGRSDTTEY